MTGWTRHQGLGVGLPFENVDTDQLIPARFMSAPRSEGYGKFLLHDLRHDADGAPAPDFPLNDPGAKGASVLVAKRNFGGGSSREAAVYALVDGGFRVVIAPSFGDIFAGNAVNNGLLPARVTEASADTLLAEMPGDLAIDLARCTVMAGNVVIDFEIDPVWRTKLINGWDDIDLTRAHAQEIKDFTAARRGAQPWLWPPNGES